MQNLPVIYGKVLEIDVMIRFGDLTSSPAN